jgi:hypothetical protein
MTDTRRPQQYAEFAAQPDAAFQARRHVRVEALASSWGYRWPVGVERSFGAP